MNKFWRLQMKLNCKWIKEYFIKLKAFIYNFKKQYFSIQHFQDKQLTNTELLNSLFNKEINEKLEFWNLDWFAKMS